MQNIFEYFDAFNFFEDRRQKLNLSSVFFEVNWNKVQNSIETHGLFSDRTLLSSEQVELMKRIGNCLQILPYISKPIKIAKFEWLVRKIEDILASDKSAKILVFCFSKKLFAACNQYLENNLTCKFMAIHERGEEKDLETFVGNDDVKLLLAGKSI